MIVIKTLLMFYLKKKKIAVKKSVILKETVSNDKLMHPEKLCK
jgi:hypothetical protein